MKNINGIAQYITKSEAVKIGTANAKNKQMKQSAEKEILAELEHMETLNKQNPTNIIR